MKSPTVAQIVKGADKVSKMQREIVIVISTITKLILSCDFKKHADIVTEFKSDFCKWEITYNADEHDLIIECFSLSREEIKLNPYGIFQVRPRTNRYLKEDHISYVFVSDVYDGLPVFLEQVVEKFPEIEPGLSCLIKASKVADDTSFVKT